MISKRSIMEYFTEGEGDRANSEFNYRADYEALRDRYVDTQIDTAEATNHAATNPTQTIAAPAA